MNTIKHFNRCFFKLWACSLMTVIMLSCNDENKPYQEGQEEQTVQMYFSATPPAYRDSADVADARGTRAVSTDWPDGSVLYLRFNDSGATGNANYDAETKLWTLSFSGTLTADVEGRCEVWYFENAVSATASSATLSPTTAVFHTSSATYYYHNNIVHLEATLEPSEVRLRYKGTPGAVLHIAYWPYYSEYSRSSATFSEAATYEQFTLTVGTDGYTPFIYCHDTIELLHVEIGDSTYYRILLDEDVKQGNSYYVQVPTGSLVSDGIWNRCREFTVTGNGKTVTFRMIEVEGGTFEMGRAGSTAVSTPVHNVSLTKNYFMGQTEVTQALWYAVMGESPTSDGDKWNSTYGLGDDYPSYYISYADCQSFLSALNRKLSSQLGSGEQFRFPTEAEWEFAAKGGNKSNGYKYSGSITLGNVAWYTSNSGGKAHDVMTKSANELGLYDMSGNVLEWCYDRYGSYSSGEQTNPTGSISASSDRVYRGGGWRSDAANCCVAYRSGAMPSDRYAGVGFRLCLDAPIPALAVSQTSLSFGSDASSQSITVTATDDYTYSSSASWLTIIQSSDKSTLTISASANNFSDRSATITLTFGSFTTTIKVVQNAKDERTFAVTGNGKTVIFKMKRVDGGTFQMGSTTGDSDESPVHSVTISKAYYMCETEVTQALWYAVMGQSPTSGGFSWSSSYGIGDNYPAYYISYEDCQSFLSALNSKLSSQLGGGESFRFPTEAEWEFAARGGNKSNGYTYSGSNTIAGVAWYTSNSNSTTHPVKTKDANELGLYDMSGNVWEWCYDWYASSYSSSAQTNPIGPTSGSNRVFRGGSWDYDVANCRIAHRNGDMPTNRYNDVGFRLCLGSPIE